MRYFDFLHKLGVFQSYEPQPRLITFDMKDKIEYSLSMPVNTTRLAYEVVSNIIDILEKQSQ